MKKKVLKGSKMEIIKTSTTPSCGGPLRAQKLSKIKNGPKMVKNTNFLKTFFFYSFYGPKNVNFQNFEKVVFHFFLSYPKEATTKKICSYAENYDI